MSPSFCSLAAPYAVSSRENQWVSVRGLDATEEGEAEARAMGGKRSNSKCGATRRSSASQAEHPYRVLREEVGGGSVDRAVGLDLARRIGQLGLLPKETTIESQTSERSNGNEAERAGLQA
jgi:hypothetical protein